MAWQKDAIIIYGKSLSAELKSVTYSKFLTEMMIEVGGLNSCELNQLQWSSPIRKAFGRTEVHFKGFLVEIAKSSFSTSGGSGEISLQL